MRSEEWNLKKRRLEYVRARLGTVTLGTVTLGTVTLGTMTLGTVKAGLGAVRLKSAKLGNVNSEARKCESEAWKREGSKT